MVSRMNECWQKEIDEIISIIKNSNEYKNYIEVSNKLQQNKDIMTLIDEVKFLQKELVKKKNKGINIKNIENEIDNKVKLLEEYPIYLEYLYLQEDLNNSINLIKSSIENYIDSIIN